MVASEPDLSDSEGHGACWPSVDADEEEVDSDAGGTATGHRPGGVVDSTCHAVRTAGAESTFWHAGRAPAMMLPKLVNWTEGCGTSDMAGSGHVVPLPWDHPARRRKKPRSKLPL